MRCVTLQETTPPRYDVFDLTTDDEDVMIDLTTTREDDDNDDIVFSDMAPNCSSASDIQLSTVIVIVT